MKTDRSMLKRMPYAPMPNGGSARGEGPQVGGAIKLVRAVMILMYVGFIYFFTSFAELIALAQDKCSLHRQVSL